MTTQRREQVRIETVTQAVVVWFALREPRESERKQGGEGGRNGRDKWKPVHGSAERESVYVYVCRITSDGPACKKKKKRKKKRERKEERKKEMKIR